MTRGSVSANQKNARPAPRNAVTPATPEPLRAVPLAR